LCNNSNLQYVLIVFKIIIILLPTLLGAGAKKVPALQPTAQLAQCIQTAKTNAALKASKGGGKTVLQLAAADLKKCSNAFAAQHS